MYHSFHCKVNAYLNVSITNSKINIHVQHWKGYIRILLYGLLIFYHTPEQTDIIVFSVYKTTTNIISLYSLCIKLLAYHKPEHTDKVVLALPSYSRSTEGVLP